MLSPRDLADLRAVAVQALPDRGTVKRLTRVSDGSLGYIETWVPIATNVPCRVDEDNDGRMAVVGGGLASSGELTLRVAHGTPLDEGDRVEVPLNGRVRVFDVQRVIETSYATVRSARVTEVR